MTDTFQLRAIHPYDELTEQEFVALEQAIDIVYFPKKDKIIAPDYLPHAVFVILKGEVARHKEGVLTDVFVVSDTFGVTTLLDNETDSVISAAAPSICAQIPAAAFRTAFDGNVQFARFFLQTVAERLRASRSKEYDNATTVLFNAKAGDMFLRTPYITKKTDSLREVIAGSIVNKTATVIVPCKDDYGVITDSDIKQFVVQGVDWDAPVHSFVKQGFVCVDASDTLANVLLTLTRRNIKRVGVRKQDTIIGVLEQMDILSFLTNHAHLLTVQIERAITQADLQDVAQNAMTTNIKRLHSLGLNPLYIAAATSEINIKLYQKAFDLVFPDELKPYCSLLVMGSEGRKEQILKTDQDNALIISDEVEDITPYQMAATELSDALLTLGFPPCPGNIMIRNPKWCKQEADFKQDIDRWYASMDMQSFMDLAIFFDARSVAGNLALFRTVHDHLRNTVIKNNVFLAYFASSVMAFATPIGLFSSLKSKDGVIDIKKGAVFAIVQGVRSLALAYRVRSTETVKRIDTLKSRGVLREQQANELQEAFATLLGLRLKSSLSTSSASNDIVVSNLTKIEKDMLKDSFIIVDEFKSFLSSHFRLDMLRQ